MVAIDLIVDLPMSSGHDSIITITDHDVTKAAIFLPCSKTITGEEVVSLYGTHIFPHYGAPTKVISDRDTRFTSRFSKELCRQLGIINNMSTAYHPQTDGQSERSNQWLEQYLRIYTTHAQDNWENLLPLAQFVHNSWPSTMTGLSPFKLLIGFIPSSGGEAVSAGALPALEQRKACLGQLRDRAQEAILNVQKLLTLYHEKNKGKGRFVPYTVGQKVWLKGTNLRLAQPSSKLGPRWYGPFIITKVISPVVYRLELPPSWKMFPTFHASLLLPYHETSEHGANYLEPPPDVIEGQEEYEVEEILGQRTYGRGKKKQYLINWKGYSAAHNSWEDASGVHAPELVKEFLQS